MKIVYMDFCSLFVITYMLERTDVNIFFSLNCLDYKMYLFCTNCLSQLFFGLAEYCSK